MRLHFDPTAGLIVVPTRLFGPSGDTVVRLALDTGATRTVVGWDRVEALGQERRDFPVLCHTLPPSATVDGVLGLDFFRGQRLMVDLRAGVVMVE